MQKGKKLVTIMDSLVSKRALKSNYSHVDLKLVHEILWKLSDETLCL